MSPTGKSSEWWTGSFLSFPPPVSKTGNLVVRMKEGRTVEGVRDGFGIGTKGEDPFGVNSGTTRMHP